jgi:hypothetical protein
MDQKKPEDSPEVAEPKAAEQLEEADFWKLRLLNRNVDFFTVQSELVQLQLVEASRTLMAYSNELATKYDLHDARQVDVNTGGIIRDPAVLAKLAAHAAGTPDGK